MYLFPVISLFIVWCESSRSVAVSIMSFKYQHNALIEYRFLGFNLRKSEDYEILKLKYDRFIVFYFVVK